MEQTERKELPVVWTEARVGAEMARVPQEPVAHRLYAWARGQGPWGLLGLVLLAFWCNWWFSCLGKDKMTGARRLAVPRYQFLGLDFQHNYHASRHWLRGGNPYEGHFGAPLEAKFAYAPVVLPLFAWTEFLEVKPAVRVWTVALAVMAALGAWAAWRTRRALGLSELPFPVILAAVVWSMPVLYALERGNYDLFVLLLIIGSAWSLRRESFLGDSAAGACLALAVWIKVYPGLLLLGLLALRRYRALLLCVLAATAIGLTDPYAVTQFVTNVREFAHRDAPSTRNVIDHTVHTLSGCWPFFWTHPRLQWVARVPGLVGAAAVILPGVFWVCWQMSRGPVRWGLQAAFLIWLAAVATFLPPVANDYNLVFLPVAALAVWDRRDPVLVHVLMAFLLLWWQPIQLSIGPKLLFSFKLLGVAAVGLSLVTRARELRVDAAEGTAPAAPVRPVHAAA